MDAKTAGTGRFPKGQNLELMYLIDMISASQLFYCFSDRHFRLDESAILGFMREEGEGEGEGGDCETIRYLTVPYVLAAASREYGMEELDG